MDIHLAKKKIFECTINITPQRYQRVRARIMKNTKLKGKPFNIHTYNLPDYTAYKTSLHYLLKREKPPISDGPIILSVLFRHEPPSSLSQKKRQELINAPWRIVKKMDVDNLLKAFLDAAQGACMVDDVQIIGLDGVYKRYAEKDGIDLVIYSPIL